jgi:hypothetical protein
MQQHRAHEGMDRMAAKHSRSCVIVGLVSTEIRMSMDIYGYLESFSSPNGRGHSSYVGIVLDECMLQYVIQTNKTNIQTNTQTSNIHHAPIRKCTFVFSFIASLDDIKVNKRWR